MYIEHLQTPHPYLVTEQQPARPFEESLHAAQAQQALEAAAGTAEYGTVLGGVLDMARLAVRQTLRWPSGEYPLQSQNGTTFDTLLAEQTTTCSGYTTVLSETLDALGIQHFIGFGNGHGFLLVPTPDGMRYEDAMFNGLSGPLGQAINQGALDNMPNQFQTYGKAGVLLNTQAMVAEKGQTVETWKGDYPWLQYDGETTLSNDALASKRFGESEARPKHTFAISIFPSAVGKSVLQQYTQYHYRLHRGEYTKALRHLTAMRGFYPEIDARNTHTSFKNLFEGLVDQRKYVAARHAIDHYFSSFAISSDPRFATLEGDMSRALAEKAGERRDADAAVAAYERALRAAKYGCDMLLGKIATTQKLMPQLA
ncbi:MAG TPA: hypothetical protein VD735_06125 [Candidatus Saccharimonadales bacterium]|nr:hypothetical protein [Candidatus Saccharimonadales bacterium]